MAEQFELTETKTSAVAKVDRVDNGKPALYNPAAFDQIWRAATLFASSDLVPACYKGKPENCFIAIEMADRLGINPFAVLQSLVIIQGKPSMEAKLITALVNDSGMFVDPLEYEIVGDDDFAADYKVRCFATMARTGKVCIGPWIDYRMVKGEGWLDKAGSKWKTIPALMFMYRAASFFAKVYCSNITMGMSTREEMEDVREPVQINPERPQNLASTRQVEHVQVQTVDHTEQATPPERKRGEPRAGAKRRNSAEVEEDRLAELADQQRAEQVATRTHAAACAENHLPEKCPCDHPVSRFDGDEEFCEACGEKLTEEQPVQQRSAAQTLEPVAQQQGGADADLF